MVRVTVPDEGEAPRGTNAAADFFATLQEIDLLLAELQRRRGRQFGATAPITWPHVGDARHVADLLRELIGFMKGGGPK